MNKKEATTSEVFDAAAALALDGFASYTTSKAIKNNNSNSIIKNSQDASQKIPQSTKATPYLRI
jgi:hypothetical protein